MLPLKQRLITALALLCAASLLSAPRPLSAAPEPAPPAASDDSKAQEVAVSGSEDTAEDSEGAADAAVADEEAGTDEESVDADSTTDEEGTEEGTEEGAEEGDEDEIVDLGSGEVEGEAVVVSSAPDSAVASVISSEQIEQSGAESLDELLQQEAGFTVNDSFSGSSVSYHGLPGKFTTVLIDGQRVAGRTFDELDFSQLPLNNIERLEIIRGPQAAAFSGDSAGVVLNLITKKGSQGSATLGLGSLGYNRQQISVGDSNEESSWYFSAGRKLREAYDFDSRYPDTDGDSFRQYDFMAKFSQKFGKDQLALQLGSFEEHSRGQSFSPPDQIRSLETFTRRFQGSLSYDFSLDQKTTMRLSQSYGSYYHNLDRFYIEFPDETLTQTGFRDELADTQLSLQNYGKDYLLSGGLERSQDRLESDRIEGASPGSPATVEAQQYAAYIAGEWYLDTDWQLNAALRYDDHEDFGGELSPKAGIRYKLDPQSSLELSAGHGFRAPSLRERHYLFASPFGYQVEGNPNLEPEISNAFNLSYNRQTAYGSLRLGAFRHDVSNLIVFNQTSEVPQVFRTENVGSARTSGLELSAERRWVTRGCPECGEEFIGLGYDLAWLAEAKDGDLDTRLVNSPAFDSRYRAFYQWPDCRLEALLRQQGSRYQDRENITQAPAFSTLDVTLNKQAGAGDLSVSALNVLDEKDGRYGPEPGREMRVEYTVKF